MKHIIFLYFILFAYNSYSQEPKEYVMGSLICENKFEESLKYFKKLNNNDKRNFKFYFYKVYAENALGKYDEVIKTSNSVLKKMPKTDSLYKTITVFKINAFLDLGVIDSSIKLNEKLIEDYPTDLNLLSNLAYLYGQNKEYYKSLKILHNTLSIDSTFYILYVNLSFYSNEVEDYINSIHFANKGLLYTKDSVWIGVLKNNLGYAQSKLISLEKGIETINQSLLFYPNNSFAYFNLGKIYLEKFEYSTACDFFQKSKEFGGFNMTMDFIEKYCNK